MTKLRIFALVMTFLFVSVVGYFVSLFARGYRFDTVSFKFYPNGILVTKSNPDGASIYINGDLLGATNTNLRLIPNTYDVEIKKDGFLSWKKRMTVKKEEVAQITAELFRTAPSLTPVTFDGASNPVVSEDFSKIAYLNKKGLWIMSVSSLPIGFTNEPKKITDSLDENVKYSFSPDSRQILLESKNGAFLLDTNQYTPQAEKVNVLSQKEKILSEWKTETDKINQNKFKLLPNEIIDILGRKSEKFSFSPDNNMVMYIASAEANININLIPQLPGSSTQKEERDIKVGKTYIYDIKEDKNFIVNDTGRGLYWMPTSRHLILPDDNKIVIMDYDGTNRQTVFSGDYIAPNAYPFVNANKLLILTNLGSSTTTPNLYSLSIK